MTADELDAFLKTEGSQTTGFTQEGSSESIGHESGRKIVDILRRNPSKSEDKYTEEDIEHMRKVVSYCKRHLAQEGKMKETKSPEELEKTKSTRSLKNWGHDPLKTTSSKSTKPTSKKTEQSTKSTSEKDKPTSKKSTKPTETEPKTKKEDKPTSKKVDKPTSKKVEKTSEGKENHSKAKETANGTKSDRTEDPKSKKPASKKKTGDAEVGDKRPADQEKIKDKPASKKTK
ncbi:hypothetical protein TREMEDRAFT_61817 [Tremella mesenterica DSM 1558]|uniref:uncharacterized protein n=1 Tax=Tremella mesenterica (strain ATCC 24925 / CBS 8224 / DSM 1558 / NBRC 9311 / NRRL Y-6157 / RJB 2259-6 / UBC 559-6) TaxID=578456 RepID=UPI0003F495A1|nr:uncharacterized protein TREMEDRAFT_61817 [Tremella mesenterica DSM 1558]EIW70054.1 hypothetical protein TREMEDRAFT_61817 [Tremella mesenterica DSM 1558]